MKKVIMALCLIWSLAFVSCENWLDVKPKAEIKWDVFFETEQGFKDALLGCYCTLSERSLYGGEMTCLFLDALAQQYYYTNTSSYNSVFMYQGEFYQFNLSSCIRQQNSLTAQFVSFSLSNLANIFYPPQFLQ